MALFETALWANDMPTFLHNAAQAFSDTAPGTPWAFWADWYQGMLTGRPMDWALQREVALIPPEDWDKGPEHIAGKIEGIRRRFELEARIRELEDALLVASQTRHGIGGNLPPEPLETGQRVAKELTFIWAPLQDLKEDVQSETPDKAKIKRILDVLGDALAKGTQWCAAKADLIVDTSIKWAIPVGGSGYLAMNPNKLSAVIEALKNLLPFLS